MEFSKPNQAIGFSTRQVSSSITSDASVPSLIERAGHDTKRRFVEFFTAQIRNKHTRRAYFRAVDRFCRWLEDHRVDRLQD
ncbi:MAG: integrase, partial [Planctomyces sp.]|nr:integrase [Planctomyces sp.]